MKRCEQFMQWKFDLTLHTVCANETKSIHEPNNSATHRVCRLKKKKRNRNGLGFHNFTLLSSKVRLIFQDTGQEYNKTGNVHIMLKWGTFLQQLSQWKSNKYYIFWACICTLRYPTYKAHVPYCPSVACPTLQYFPTLSHKRHDLQKNVTEHTICVLTFLPIFVWKISHSMNNSARYHKCTQASM